MWAEAGAQPEVEEALGIGGFGYPAMAAMNARKMKYALLRGSFSETGINEFLRELAVGRGSTAPVKNAQLPKVLDTDGWDGKDGQVCPKHPLASHLWEVHSRDHVLPEHRHHPHSSLLLLLKMCLRG